MPPARSSAIELPSREALQRLALSDTGFVFDPVSGNSFTVNGVGLDIIRLLQRDTDLGRVVKALQESHDVDAPTAERDVIEFLAALRTWVR